MASGNVKIRVFKEEDYWQVESLVREFMNNDPFSPPVIARQVQDLFAPFFLVAVDTQAPGSTIIGYIMGGIEFANKNTGWVLEIFVKGQYRNKGIGYELLHALIPKLRKAGVTEIRLTVDIKNYSAISMYKKNGFIQADCLNEHYRKNKKVFLMKNILS